MQSKISSLLIGALAAFALGNSFPAYANSDEKDLGECEEALSSSNGLAPAVEFQLTLEMSSADTESVAWVTDEVDGIPWLQAFKRGIGTVPQESKFFAGSIPMRVRIMPVGRSNEIHPHRSRTGEMFFATAGGPSLQILKGSENRDVLFAIPFSGWDNVVPKWSQDERQESVLVAVNRSNELNVFYPFSPEFVPVVRPLNGLEPENVEVVRDTDGRVLISTSRSSSGGEVLVLRDGALYPLAVLPSYSHLYSGLGDRPWLAWTDIGADGKVVVRAALFEGLTTPAFSYTLEVGETVKGFAYNRISESSGQLTLLTSTRVLSFLNSTR